MHDVNDNATLFWTTLFWTTLLCMALKHFKVWNLQKMLASLLGSNSFAIISDFILSPKSPEKSKTTQTNWFEWNMECLRYQSILKDLNSVTKREGEFKNRYWIFNYITISNVIKKCGSLFPHIVNRWNCMNRCGYRGRCRHYIGQRGAYFALDSDIFEINPNRIKPILELVPVRFAS